MTTPDSTVRKCMPMQRQACERIGFVGGVATALQLDFGQHDAEATHADIELHQVHGGGDSAGASHDHVR